jgi:dihydroorotate dehydrogenase
MVYEGPGLPSAIVKGLSKLVAREGVESIRDLRDSAVDRWADRKLG